MSKLLSKRFNPDPRPFAKMATESTEVARLGLRYGWS